MTDGGVILVPLDAVGAFDAVAIGFEVRRALRAGVGVGRLAQSPSSDVDDLEALPTDLEGVAHFGVGVAAVQLGDLSLQNRLTESLGGQ